MALREKKCSHLTDITSIKEAQNHQCAECVRTGGTWVHLRTCQSCGITLCCDSSPGKHASKHAGLKNHPVMSSAEPNEKWLWCYVDQKFLKY